MQQTAYPRITTDETMMETIAHGSASYPFAFYDETMSMFDFYRIDWHWHTELEFVCVEAGTVTISVGQEQLRLTAEEGLLINSRELHQIVSGEDAVIPNFLCSPEFLAPQGSLLYRKYMAPVLNSGIPYVVFKEEIPWQREILEKLRKIITLQKQKNRSDTIELETAMLFQSLWITLYRNTDPASMHSAPAHASAEKGRLLMMLEFLEQHYPEQVSLENIAQQAAVSKSTAAALFKKYLNTTPVEYLIAFRLKKAAELLADTEKKVGAVAELAGFENVDYFCRSFKKHYGITPTEYRRTRAR